MGYYHSFLFEVHSSEGRGWLVGGALRAKNTRDALHRCFLSCLFCWFVPQENCRPVGKEAWGSLSEGFNSQIIGCLSLSPPAIPYTTPPPSHFESTEDFCCCCLWEPTDYHKLTEIPEPLLQRFSIPKFYVKKNESWWERGVRGVAGLRWWWQLFRTLWDWPLKSELKTLLTVVWIPRPLAPPIYIEKDHKTFPMPSFSQFVEEKTVLSTVE